MNMPMRTNQIITDWQPHFPALFGKHTLALSHSLASSPLFTDEALARLIDAAPRRPGHFRGHFVPHPRPFPAGW